MSFVDLMRFSGGALRGHRLRTGMSLLGVAIGVASVILLTSLGEGARVYVTGQFEELGTNLMIVLPGKTETTGAAPIMGGVPNDLTVEDVEAIVRFIPQVRRAAPLSLGEAQARYRDRSRSVSVVGTTADFQLVRHVKLRSGQYLPQSTARQGERVCVLGAELARELFAGTNPLGELLRLGEERFRVVGVIEATGLSIGLNLDESVHVPVRSGLRMFNRSGLFRAFIEVGIHHELEATQAAVIDLVTERHDGEEDITVITQDAVLTTFGRILGALTAALGAIAAVSLTVAGIGIMNVMLVSVSERTSEIGLLKALGAGAGQILIAFLTEAAILSSMGGGLGLAAGIGCGKLFQLVYPSFPVEPPVWAIVASILLSVVVGIVFGALPARRASRLDPVNALAGEVTMISLDLMRLAWGSVLSHRLRSTLTMLGILIGVASVILLTSIGEGTRQYIVDEFTQFGTNILAINPGKTMTTGQPGALAATTRRLTIEDAEALTRVPGVRKVVPVAFGMARVESGSRGRSVIIYGVNSQVPDVWKFRVRQGRFLPEGDPRRGSPVTVLGPKLKRELFGPENALGRYVRIGGSRYQVIGVMAPKGMLMGMDIDDSAYIPVASAQTLFNRDELIEIDVLFSHQMDTDTIVEGIKSALMARHDDEEDFTIMTQTQMLDVLDRVMDVVGIAVGGIGAISLIVGAIGILTMMWISVNERTAEIGLAKAIGAGPGQVLGLFLIEAALLSFVGGGLGILTGIGIARTIQLFLPGLPVHTPLRYVVAALAVSLLVGLLSGVLPARRASRLEPIEALHAD